MAGDPGRIARFEREAKVLASLNHPHIAARLPIKPQDALAALFVAESVNSFVAPMAVVSAQCGNSRTGSQDCSSVIGGGNGDGHGRLDGTERAVRRTIWAMRWDSMGSWVNSRPARPARVAVQVSVPSMGRI